MSNTPEWMHGAEDWDRAAARAGPPLVGIALWALGLAMTAVGVVTLERLFG